MTEKRVPNNKRLEDLHDTFKAFEIGAHMVIEIYGLRAVDYWKKVREECGIPKSATSVRFDKYANEFVWWEEPAIKEA